MNKNKKAEDHHLKRKKKKKVKKSADLPNCSVFTFYYF